jgi:2,4-dienoyl-CoA reductase-like NADH-dependent reductase (Old Yellow Enzyme family)/thioredoxin reductase
MPVDVWIFQYVVINIKIKERFVIMLLKLLEPILIGGSHVKNRIVMAPMETRLSTISGNITQALIDYYAQRAKGGAGIIIVENTYIDNLASRASLSSSGLYSDQLIAGKNLLAEAIQENGALAIIQLSHGGRQARAGATAYEAVAPSAVMCSVTKRMPHILTKDEIIKIEDSFAEAAYRAKQAGFDGVELHGAHGYLVCSFLSPLTNLRSDEYGGSLKNRGRFAANILQKIRSKVGAGFIVGYRISASEYIKGGLEPQEACDFVVSIQHSINYIHVSAGVYESPSFWAIAPTYVPAGQMIPLASQMKKAVNIPVIAVGSLNPKLAEQVLQEGKADMIAFGRALIADPFMPKKLAEGRQEDIRPCIRGNEGCISRFYSGCTIRCEVNPACGQEAHYRIRKTKTAKRVLIAGGGVSGMEAARVAALMGHQVTLIEKEKMLGGHMLESTKQDFKANEAGFFKWLVTQVEKSGVKILLNTMVTPALIAGEKPDFLILAVGSQYMRPAIPGAESALLPVEVLENASLAGEEVIVVGGGLVGAETALTLAIDKRKVTLLEMTDQIAQKHESSARQALIERLKSQNVSILTSHTVMEIAAGQVTAKDANGMVRSIDADTVVLATGLASRAHSGLTDIIPGTVCIGDCKEARKIYQCMHEAWNAVINTLSDECIG